MATATKNGTETKGESKNSTETVEIKTGTDKERALNIF